MRGFTHCYFHQTVPDSLEQYEEQRRIPLLEDANSIQVAIMKVIRGLADGRLDQKQATLLLWALQIAASNVRRTRFDLPGDAADPLPPATTH